MPEIGDSQDAEHIERRASQAQKEAWIQTNEDMEAIADERRDDGWEVVAIPAVNTAPLSPEAGDDDRFGIVHVIPGNYADEFADAYEKGEFPRYEAYRSEIEGFVYLVTEFLDPDTKTAILVAGQYELRNAPPMVVAADEEGALYTHVETLDGTILGSFRHEEFEPLVPKPDKVKDWHKRPDLDE